MPWCPASSTNRRCATLTSRARTRRRAASLLRPTSVRLRSVLELTITRRHRQGIGGPSTRELLARLHSSLLMRPTSPLPMILFRCQAEARLPTLQPPIAIAVLTSFPKAKMLASRQPLERTRALLRERLTALAWSSSIATCCTQRARRMVPHLRLEPRC